MVSTEWAKCLARSGPVGACQLRRFSEALLLKPFLLLLLRGFGPLPERFGIFEVDTVLGQAPWQPSREQL